jgi:hypothetical protein
MNDDEIRGFTIADGLILIAGFAAGLGLMRAVAPDLTPGQVWDALANPREGWSPWHAFAVTLELGAFLFAPAVAGWTPACLLLQLARPRPRWRRLAQRPGFVACLIATATLAAGLVITSACLWLSILEFVPGSDDFLKAGVPIGIIGGAGVFWGWGVMRLCGICRPRPEWRDRLGRLTGALWIAIAGIATLYCFLALD